MKKIIFILVGVCGILSMMTIFVCMIIQQTLPQIARMVHIYNVHVVFNQNEFTPHFGMVYALCLIVIIVVLIIEALLIIQSKKNNN